jgi:hypothetical protein
MQGKKEEKRKAIVDAITHCWELLDSRIFVKLVVDRVQTVIKAEG